MLTVFQKRIVDHITTETLSVSLGSHSDPRDKERLRAAGYYAFALYCDLRSTGHTLEFSNLMIKNRGLDPSNPAFFMHVSPLTDLVHMVSKLSSSVAIPTFSIGMPAQRTSVPERVEPLIGLDMA